MTSLIRDIIRRDYSESIQWVRSQVNRVRRSTSQAGIKNPLNKTFIEPLNYPDLSATFKKNITTTITAFFGAASSPLLAIDAVPFSGKIAAACMLIPSVFAIRKLYQTRFTPIQSSREVELMNEYTARSDEEIKEELKQTMVGMLPNGNDFYDEHTQNLMKPWITSSIERACIPMFIRYKIAHEKYQALEEQFPLMQAIEDRTPPEMKGKSCSSGGSFFHDLFRAKLDAAFILALLCYPVDIEATHLNDLGMENPYVPEILEIECAEVPFFIKKGCKLIKGVHSYKFTNREDYISCKQVAMLSLQELAEELLRGSNTNDLVRRLNEVRVDSLQLDVESTQ